MTISTLGGLKVTKYELLYLVQFWGNCTLLKYVAFTSFTIWQLIVTFGILVLHKNTRIIKYNLFLKTKQVIANAFEISSLKLWDGFYLVSV